MTLPDIGPTIDLGGGNKFRHDYSGTRRIMGSPGAKAVIFHHANRLAGVVRPRMAVETGANKGSLTFSLYKYRENPNMGAVWTAKIIARGKSRNRKKSHAAAHEYKSNEMRKALITASLMSKGG